MNPQITQPVVDARYAFVHKGQVSKQNHCLQYLHHHQLQHLQPSPTSVAWSTPNLTTYQGQFSLAQQQQQQQHHQLLPPGHYVSQFVPQNRSNGVNSNYSVVGGGVAGGSSNNTSSVTGSMALPSKLPQKKSDPSSRIPGPGSNLRLNGTGGQGNSVRSKINSSAHNGHSGQSSALIAGRDTARRSASPQVTVKTTSASPSNTSPLVSLSSLGAGPKSAQNVSTPSTTNTSPPNCTTSNNSTVNGLNNSLQTHATSDIRIRKASSDRSTKFAIRPPRPTSIPSVPVENKLTANSASSNGQVVSGKNAINKYLTGPRVPKIPSSASPSVTHCNGKQQPLKEFMASRRIVESATPPTPTIATTTTTSSNSSSNNSSSDHSTSKIATITPSTKATATGETMVTDSSCPQGKCFTPISPSTLSRDLSINSTNSVLAPANHKIGGHKPPQQQRGQKSPSPPPPPVTPRKVCLANNNSKCLDEIISLSPPLNAIAREGNNCSPDKGLTVEVSCGQKASTANNNNSSNNFVNSASKKASPSSSISINGSLKSPSSTSSFSLCSSSSPSSLSPTATTASTCSDGGNRGRFNQSTGPPVTNNSLSTFTITSTVTSTSPPPPSSPATCLSSPTSPVGPPPASVIPSDPATTLTLSPFSSSHSSSSRLSIHQEPHHPSTAVVASQSTGKEDQNKSTNGTSGDFDRINAPTAACKATELSEPDQVPFRQFFASNNINSSRNCVTDTFDQVSHLTSNNNSNSNGNTSTPANGPAKSIQVYPFIREEPGALLGQFSMSSLLHSMSSRRLDKISSNGHNMSEYPLSGAALARSSFNLTTTNGGGGYSGTSPISFSSSNNPGDIGMRPCDFDSVGVKFPSMRSLVTPPPTPFAPVINSSASSHLRRLSKNSDLRGSAASLLSGSSNFSTAEEKQVSEIKRLKNELNRANEKIATLSTQLVTSSQMVSAFDQSLSSMTNRLHQMTLSCEQKDREINSLKETIEHLRREHEKNLAESSEKSKITSMAASPFASSTGSNSRPGSRKNSSCDQLNGKKVRMRSCSRDRGGDSLSINSTNADSSTSGWIRQSISRAFRKNRARSKSGNESGSDVDSLGSRSNLSSLTGGPDANGCSNGTSNGPSNFTSTSRSCKSSTLPMTDSTSSKTLTKELDNDCHSPNVTELRQNLREKERALTDLRLESLSLAHQMEGMKESMAQMKDQMDDLKSENLKLHFILQSESATGDKSAFAKNSSFKLTNSVITSCDQINSQNSTDPLMVALKRLQDATAE